MKISVARQQYSEGRLERAEIRPNPANPNEWFVMLYDNKMKTYVLVNEEEEPLVDRDANELLALLKSFGFNEVSVIFYHF